MRLRPKPLHDQVMVITGASSGIGLATARLAASRGARVVLSARSDSDLGSVSDAIRRTGGQAVPVAADVADARAVDTLGARAVEAFGRIDTWVNNAGVSVYGSAIEVPLDDERRVFETNYWGVVHGCRTAVARMRATGGTIINIGSVVSERAVPLQAAYTASKHAVKGYTDALRMELEHERVPIAVTLVKPAAVDTPYFDHAKNYMTQEPTPVPPVYATDVVARAICRCAERPVRDITVGGGGLMMKAMETISPRMSDLYMERTMFEGQMAERPNNRRDSLHSPRAAGREAGAYNGRVMRSSLYTRAMLSDARRALPFIAVGAAVAAGLTAARYRS